MVYERTINKPKPESFRPPHPSDAMDTESMIKKNEELMMGSEEFIEKLDEKLESSKEENVYGMLSKNYTDGVQVTDPNEDIKTY
jgi:hypothetical protein